jgi:ribose transport system permease protein
MTASASSQVGGGLAGPAGRLRRLISGNALIVAMVVVALAFALVQPSFLSQGNMVVILKAATILAVVAFGQFLVIVSGAIDVSIGANVALGAASLEVALQAGLPAPAAAVVAIMASALVGSVNGLLVARVKLPAIVVTLAMLSLIRGALTIAFSGKPLLLGQVYFDWLWDPVLLGLPPSTLLVALLAVLLTVFVRWTEPGRAIYAVGGNESAARAAGLQVGPTRIMTFIIAGAMAGLAGILIMGKQTAPLLGDLGNGYEFLAIAAVVVGGTNIFGGSGRVSGVLAGTILLFAINNIMVFTGIPAVWQTAVVGLLILMAAIIDITGRQRRHRRGAR